MLPINRGELHQLYNTFSCIWAGWRSATLTTTSLGSKLNALEYLLSTFAMLSPLNMEPHQHLELLTSNQGNIDVHQIMTTSLFIQLLHRFPNSS